MNKRKSRSALIIIIVPVVLIVFLCVNMLIQNRLKQMKPIPKDTVGNTAGNIRGGGRFCEYKGKVYFSNPYDGYSLYVMNPDGSEMKKLLPTVVSYINAGGEYLFYYMQGSGGGAGLGYLRSTTGIYRCSLSGKEGFCLDKDMATMMVLVGDQLYTQHYDNDQFSTLYKIPADGSKKENQVSKDIVETACALNDKLYYAGETQDHYLYEWNTKTDSTRSIWQGNICYPTVVGDDVYFLNLDANYRLFRYNLASEELTQMTNERIDSYNIYENVIYYQTNSASAPALMRMTLDGENQETVMTGVFHRINVTSAYTYFQPFGDDSVVYRTSTFGPVEVDTFPEAMEAALKSAKK